MTSSSDNEFQRRRLFVHGIPPKSSNASIATFFASFGPVTAVHNSKHGYAFVTFEEEDAAIKALGANGDVFQGKVLSIEFSHSGRHPPQPLSGARRLVQFPKPFCVRGRNGGGAVGYRSAAAGASLSTSSPSSCLPENSPALSFPRFRPHYVQQQQQQQQQQHQHLHHQQGHFPGSLASGSSSGRGGHRRGGGGHHHHHHHTRQQQRMERRGQIFPHNVKIVHSSEYLHENPPQRRQQERSRGERSKLGGGEGNGGEEEEEELCETYRKLFSFASYPHIAKVFFLGLDAASLMRCKLVCKEWYHNIKDNVENSPRIRSQLLSRWRGAECSFYPITPSMYSPAPGAIAKSPDSSYRNVLSLMCDESEIMLAVDNGNVEIYDRRSFRLKTVLVGQFASSPTSLDFDAEIILVGYTCGFRRLNRKFPSSWNVYDRVTKELLHSVERFGDDDVRIGFSGHLYVTTVSGVFSVYRYSDPESLRTRKVFATHETDTIEAFDLDRGHGVAVGVVRQNEAAEKRLVMRVWEKPDETEFVQDEQPPPADFMTRLRRQFFVLEDYARENDDFLESKCKCLSVQLRHPLCMCFFSNAFGYFEYFEDRGKPYSLFAFYDVESERCLRVVRVDEAWMRRHEVVPYDYDSGVLSARFSRDHLVLGFGSFSNRRDGGIAVFPMEEVLGGVHDPDLSVTKIPAPFYHWTGWDGHTGGVTALHVDSFQLVAVNSCVHQVSTRCIEGGDESKKDNVIVYDFWTPGKDLRR